MGVPRAARLNMLGLLYVAVLAVQVAMPEGHPLREATGGSPGAVADPRGGRVVGACLSGGAEPVAGAGGADRGERERDAAAVEEGPFSGAELERYARHITLPDIGGAGQLALKEAKVLVVGAGGLGAPALLYLAAAGVGRIGIIDGDTVALSNLQRQVIHTDARQDMPKVFSAQAAIEALNPHVEVRPYNRALTEDIAEDLFAEYDLILDGTDSYETRALVNRAAVAVGRPVLAGAISAWEGQVTLYDPASGAPCMACVFPNAPAPDMAATCAETGVIGALPGVVGSMMALEAVKHITGRGGARGRMLIYDGCNGEMRSFAVKRRPIARSAARFERAAARLGSRNPGRGAA
jgi:molybdopterin/thiamine biosynthesis adenylyltransferase